MNLALLSQLDYIFFFCGLWFILLAVVCFSADRKRSSLPWTWLGLFGLIHGLNEWLDMLALSMGDSPLFKAARICVMALSFICLVEFGRLGMRSVTGRGPGRWVTLALFLVGCTGWLYGWVGLNVFFRYSLGFVGGMWSALAIIQYWRHSDDSGERRTLLALGILLATYAAASGIIVPKAPFLPASILNHDSFLQMLGFPIQLLRGMLAVASAYCMWRALGFHRTQRAFRIVFVCSLLVILAGGWYATNRQGISEQRRWTNNLKSACKISAASINSELVKGIDSIEDLQNPRYKLLKKRLMKMRQAFPEARYIYLMVVRNGRIIFSADSEAPTSKDYSPPGDEYTDAPAELRALCHGERQSATAEYEDKWGQWVSAFVTVREDATDKPVAILGMDYPQEAIGFAVNTKRLNSIFVTLLVAIVTILLFWFHERREHFITSISKASEVLRENEKQQLLLTKNALSAIAVHEIVLDTTGRPVDYVFLSANPAFETHTGLKPADMLGRRVTEVLPGIEKTSFIEIYGQVVLSGESVSFEQYSEQLGRYYLINAYKVEENRFATVFNDITERKNAELEIKQARDQYQSLVENIPGITYRCKCDADWTMLFMSDSVDPLSGYPSSDFIGNAVRTYASVIHPNDTAFVAESINKAVAEGRPWDIEYRICHKNGDIRWVHEKGRNVPSKDGGVGLLDGFILDITERKQAEEALREEHERLENVLAATGTGIDIIDSDFNLQYVDKGWQKIYGDLTGRKCYEYFCGLSEPCPGCGIPTALETKQIVVTEEVLSRENNKIVEVHSIPFQNAEGQWLVAEINIDITERKQAEGRLAESEIILKDILESTLSGFWDWNLVDNTEYLSPTFKRMFGYEDHEMENSPESWQRIIFPEDLPGVLAVFERHVKSHGRERFYNEIRYRHRDGSTVWVICAGRVIEWADDGTAIRMTGCHIDITERKQAEGRQQLSADILGILNQPLELAESINRILTAIKLETGFDAVGLRLKDGDDFPYFAQNGFSNDFLLAENTLVVPDKNGGLCRDKDGNISLECTCGLVISGQTDPSHPLFTPGGSCWTNNSLPLLDMPADQDPRLHPRNRCIHDGFLSVALIPIRMGEKIVGLLQLNDRTVDRLTLRMVQYFEGIGASIGMMLMKKQTEETLRKSEYFHRTTIQTAMDGFWRVGMQGPLLEVNESYCRMSGYSEQELLAMNIFDLEAKESGSQTDEHITKVIEHGQDRFESQHRRKDGSIFDIDISVKYQPDDGGHLIVFLRDITERKQAEKNLADRERRYRLLWESSTEGFCLHELVTDADGVAVNYRILDVNPVYESIVGVKKSDVVGKLATEAYGRTEPPYLEIYARVAQSGVPEIFETVFRQMDKHFSIGVFSPSPGQFATAISDISERKTHEDVLSWQASHDALTGLPNRNGFDQHLGELITGRAGNKSRSMTVLFLDLDQFKMVNDTLGHKVGDLLLVEVADRLQSCLRSEDILTRMGGDEFIVILPRCNRRSIAQSVASRMIDSISRPFEIHGHRFVIGASIGLASYPSDGTDTVTLVKHADAAMYKAKQAGRGTFCWYSDEVGIENQQRAEMEMSIRDALQNNQFMVYYQPVLRIEDGSIHAAEALLRWEHPEKGMISPSLFIPIAEEIGLIGQIGDYVLRTACAQTTAWRDEGIDLSQIGVNVSTRQIRDAGWLDSVSAALSDTGLDARFLNLEVTETDFATDYKSMRKTLQQVQKLGICMSIDDFGMGQSSLSRLKDFPVIHLKIDGSFIRDIAHGTNDTVLVRSIVDMAHGQDIKVTAEWVENEAQMEVLRSVGCDFAQGYFISPALPAEAFGDFVRKWTRARQKAKAA